MLGKRIITAVVLLCLLAIILSVDSRWPLLLFLSLTVSLTAFEWVRLTAPKQPVVPVIMGLLVGAATGWQATLWLAQISDTTHLFGGAIILTAIVWLIVIPLTLRTASVNDTRHAAFWTLFAPIGLYAAWGSLALIWLRFGAWTLLSLLVLIWIADIFAYFGGRQFGKHKLAPNISPGKTREGALIGLLGVVAWMALSSQVAGSYASLLLANLGWLGLLIGSVLLGVLAVMGDLFESLLKRQAQVKDSSHLLPGHGGVYDRVDAVVSVVPIAYVLVFGFQVG